MKSFAVVDDAPLDAKRLETLILGYGKEHGLSFAVDCYSSPVRFLSEFKGQYDLIFLDMEMPLMNGMSLAREIRKNDESVALIFVTNFSQYAINSYEVQAMDYLVKPVEARSFVPKFERALSRLRQQSQKNILLKTETGIRKVDLEEVSYVEVRGHYLFFHTTEGIFKVRGLMKNLVGNPDFQKDFYLCNRGYLVNLNAVTGVDGLRILLGKESIAMSRLKKSEFMDALASYYGTRKN